MSSSRHDANLSGTSRPDVLSEATDLDTLFAAIVGKAPDGKTTETVAKPATPASVDKPGDPERQRTPLEEFRRARQPAAPYFSAPPEIRTFTESPPRVEAQPELLVPPPPPPAAALETSAPELEEFEAINEPEAATTGLGRLRVVRTSQWPVMVFVGVMALVTVSALGLRGGSSAATETPVVAPAPSAQPDGYAAQLPAEPLPADQSLAPASTAYGDSPWKPAAAPPSAPPISAPATTPVAPVPAALKPTPPPVAKPAAVAPIAATQKGAAAIESAPSTPEPATDPPVVEPASDAVRLINPPPPTVSAPEPGIDSPPSTTAPPAVSSARSSASTVGREPVPELPRPPASRTLPLVAARRLTGGMPEYSATLRQRKVGGVVDVEMRIDINGRVVSAVAVSGPSPLRESAEAAVLKWRYAPATRNGIPIETESRVSFSFDPSQSRRQ